MSVRGPGQSDGSPKPHLGSRAPVPLRVYPTLTVLILWFIANAFFAEVSSRNPSPESFVLRAYLAVFGHRRWLFTWPIIWALVWGADTLIRKIVSRMRGGR